ncbi:MAG: ABC transporter permease [Bacteroidota bacterium]
MEILSTLPWELFFNVISILSCGFFGLLILLVKFPAASHLGRLQLLFMLLVVSSLFPEIPLTLYVILVAIAVQLYLYAIAFFYQKTRTSILHAIPMICVIPALWMNNVIIHFLSGIISMIYVVLLLRLLRNESHQRGFNWFENPGKRISWFRNFIIASLVGLVVWLLIPIHSAWIAGYTQLLLAMVVFQVFRESSFFSPIPIGTKYQKSTLTPQIKSIILSKIHTVVQQQEFFLRDDASLPNLAKSLGVSTHHLSQVLNESMKISFQDLIAQYRIKRACQLLKDEAFTDVKIENVAFRVGYNSKSAFNAAFKRKLGLTPSEYRASKHVLTYREGQLPDNTGIEKKALAFDLNHVFHFKSRSDMIHYFIKIFIRNIRRNRLFAVLNVSGLAIGFTCSLLIYMYIQDELSYDRSLPGSDEIYRIAWMSDNPQTRTPHPMAAAMRQDFPEVVNAVSLSPWYGPGLSKDMIRVENVKQKIVFEEPDFYFADSTFFEVFDVGLIEGDQYALHKPYTLVITRSIAKKYFGDTSAVGQELRINDMPLAVTAVVEDMPKNSHFHFNAIIPYVTLKNINPSDDWMTWEDFGHFNYVKLAEGTKASSVEKKITPWVVNYLDWSQTGLDRLESGEMYFALQPVEKIHLTSDLRWELENNGNILHVYILIGTMAFLLVIASINYINLTTAKSIERAKEVGIRKTLGGVSRKISAQFYFESILMSLIAFLIALVCSSLLLGIFNSLSGKSFAIADIFETSLLIKAFFLCVIIGLMAGFYPALVLSSFQPAHVLKGKMHNGAHGGRIRSTLVIMQFSISAVLISGSIIIFKQLQFMKEKDLGFNQDALISLNIPTSIEIGGIDLQAVRRTQNELSSLSSVRSTSLVSSLPGGQFNQHSYYSKSAPENRFDASSVMVDFGIEKVLGLEVIKGRTFNHRFKKDSIWNIMINEKMASSLQLDDPIGKTIVQYASGKEYEYTIIGIVKDFHFQSLHQEIQPLILSAQPLETSHLLVKLEGVNFTQSLEKIRLIYQENLEKDLPFEYQFLDDQLANLYDQEARSLSIFSFFALIALALACKGLLGIALAVLNQRIKEVGMRKILGATSLQVMKMIFGQFAKLILFSAVIAVPIAYILAQKWMQEFSYQIIIGIVPFALTIVILLLLSLLSVSSAVMKIAYTSPAQTLRYE